MIKKICLCTCFLSLLLGPELVAQSFILDKVVAKVGNEVIFHSEIEENYAAIAEGQTPTDDLRCTIFEGLLVKNLLIHYAKIDSIVVTEDEIERQMNARIEQILAHMGNDVQRFEDYYGVTIAEVREKFREDLERQMLEERKRGEIVQEIKVTPSEVIAFYEQIPLDSMPLFNAEVELGEIVYKPPVNPEERSKALTRIQQVQEKIKSGEDFAELANKFSDDPGNRGRGGGDLGWVTRGTFVPEFEAVAFKLSEGQFSEIVETDFGFHIIQLLERKGLAIHVRHILIRPDITRADLELAQEHLMEIRELILTDSLTFEAAVKKYSDDDAQSYYNAGRMVNPKTGNTFYETADLDPDVFFATDTIDINDITPPIEFKAQTGDIIYKIFQLQSRTAPHRANLSQDYSKIVNAAKESKRNEEFNKWMRAKILDTYVEVDPSYQDCENLKKWQNNQGDIGDLGSDE